MTKPNVATSGIEPIPTGTCELNGERRPMRVGDDFMFGHRAFGYSCGPSTESRP